MPTAVGVMADSYNKPAGGGGWTPGSMSGLLAWWDADDVSTFTFSSGAVVSEWRDKSASARHLTQSNLANQPTRNGTVNGHTSVVFNGTAGRLLFTAAAWTKPVTLLMVARNTATSGQRNPLMFRTEGRVYRPTTDDIQVYQGAVLLAGGTWGTGVRSLVTVFNGASSKVAFNSGSYVTGNAGGSAFSTGVSNVGAAWSNDSEFWQGDICEIVIQQGEISAPDLASWWGYCQMKWGTP